MIIYRASAAVALSLLLAPVAAHGISPGQRFVALEHPPVPSYVANFQGGNLPTGVAETRATTAWDYSTSVDGVTTPIVAFNATVPRWPSWSQRVPSAYLGLGVWAGIGNIWRMSSQTQTRTVTNGSLYTFWCDSANGTDSVTFSGSLTGTATCNGWAGAISGTASGTSTTGTVTGTFTQGNLNLTALFPPIVTAGATVTVGADVSSVPISGVAGYNPQAGTVVVTFYPPAVGSTAKHPFVLDDGTANNRIDGVITQSPNNYASMTTVVAGVTTGNGANTVNTINTGAINKVAYSWGTSMLCSSLNGGPMGSTVTTGLPTVTTLELGQRAGAQQLNGYIEKVAYYPKRLCHLTQQLSMIRH